MLSPTGSCSVLLLPRELIAGVWQQWSDLSVNTSSEGQVGEEEAEGRYHPPWWPSRSSRRTTSRWPWWESDQPPRISGRQNSLSTLCNGQWSWTIWLVAGVLCRPPEPPSVTNSDLVFSWWGWRLGQEIVLWFLTEVPTFHFQENMLTVTDWPEFALSLVHYHLE